MLHFEIYVPFSINDEISKIIWDMNNDGISDVQTQYNYHDYEYETYGNYNVNVVIHQKNGNEIMMQMMAGLRSGTQLLMENYNTMKLKELLFILKNHTGLTTIHY